MSNPLTRARTRRRPKAATVVTGDFHEGDSSCSRDGYACGAASAQTLEDLKNDGKNPDNVLTYGMGYSLKPLIARSSKSTRRRSNALVPIWNLSLDNPWGEQAQPLLLDGVMYVTNAKATVCDRRSAPAGRSWKTPGRLGAGDAAVVCCGVSNTGRRDPQRQALPLPRSMPMSSRST